MPGGTGGIGCSGYIDEALRVLWQNLAGGLQIDPTGTYDAHLLNEL